MTNTYRVEFVTNGSSQSLEIPDDQFILQSALDAGLDLPSSCNAGVCTTCAARILEGQVDLGDCMGLGPSLQDQGYVLLCVAKAKSDLKLQVGCEDEVYDLQFGQSA
ncbi:MAG: 2Fe-2S iron-sulfur cluster-binding protein [Cyanobacteria bacterium]|nr:2Fe-2S iron-sulfur cluster-binding protein [Cyanobacteriota bacterium]